MLENLSDGLKKYCLAYIIRYGKRERSIVIPIRKPVKDPKSPGSCKPIALTPQMGRILE